MQIKSARRAGRGRWLNKTRWLGRGTKADKLCLGLQLHNPCSKLGYLMWQQEGEMCINEWCMLPPLKGIPELYLHDVEMIKLSRFSVQCIPDCDSYIFTILNM